MSHLLEKLNQAQKQAASHMDGPFVVFAGAGSGKTRIITTRIAYLIEHGVRPWEILAVTFTNKAAGEMKERVEAICPEAKRATITTFHSACARWLREFASELGFQTNFSIYDDSDSNKLLKKLLKEANPKGDIPNLLADMKSFLHIVKTNGYFPSDVERLHQEMSHLIPIGGVALYRRYQEELANCNAMDFGDLLLNVLLLLRRNKTVSDILSQRFRHVLVDEFQDTNRTQFEIIRRLSERHGNLFVVGDDDQSIYSWRGATPANIIDFQRTFPGAKKIALEQNYRCSGNIVKAASTMIAKNVNRAEKTLFTEAHEGDSIDLHIESDGEMEAWWVINSIKQERPNFPYDDVAIFYRTNSQSRSLEEALRRENIPYTIFGSVEFYDRMEIKDILAYLKVLVNPNDAISITRIINTPTRGIGAKAVETIERETKSRKLPMMDVIRQLADEKIPRVSPKFRFFVDLMDALKKDLLGRPLPEVIETLLEAIEYPEYLKKKFPDQYIDKTDNIHELGSAIADFAKREPEATLDDWIQSITLVRDRQDLDTVSGVSLMTLHMAKGLEFRRVYLTGIEDGLLPHRNSVEDNQQLEEERRLLYVGITRAKEKLSLTGASRRRTFNNYVVNSPSRFIAELPQETLNVSFAAKQVLDAYRADDEQPDEEYFEHTQEEYSYEPEPEALEKGSSVSHPTYGRGVVEGFETKFGQTKVIVKFYDFGFRKIKASQLNAASSSLDY
ncbi:ATP-dependent helicase [Pseudobacteriovorax antillogorgiicola]|uniref:DNA 3'-5' helicase n=1 Tax=Pseudobacteriovorax antillogorgiicola TaxID=1513793 RepID=A0A1Y6CQZ4_9BACT|nr:UvrD-helicase domain-containing protein [Pseudobacteriovorax antillogorgiicola]TCS46693.1 DNA helicase-2/ATP-dependent DNA helicase PcrA [Pseudobacteriovorax antillogorgiicola]SMF66810.1 DNA helicase-2 / ATP-dependent DNA helicase PcrA [Pseudobacteriovorax antillogorgiicola]